VDSDDFFEGHDNPVISAGRYQLPHPETGKMQSWTRATTHAELPEDSFALTRHQGREIIRGLQARPDVLRLLQASADPLSDADCDGHVATALAAVQSDAKANNGTAVHEALRRVDRAWNTNPRDAANPISLEAWLLNIADVPEWAMPHARNYVAELNRHGLRPLPEYTERRVINTALGCAGTIDNLYEESDGTIVLGDKKTGRVDRFTERAQAIQCAVYRGADYLLSLNPSDPPLDLRSVGLRLEYAVLVHVDPDDGTCVVYRIDLRRGQLGANLAADVRAWRRERHFLLPYVQPGVSLAGLTAAPLTSAQQDWVSNLPDGDLTLSNMANPPLVSGRHLAAVPSKPPAVIGEPESAWLAAAQPEPPRLTPTENIPVGPERIDPGTFAVSGGLPAGNTAPCPTCHQPPQIRDVLMRMTKAELQTLCKSHGVTENLAKHKGPLIDYLVPTGHVDGETAAMVRIDTAALRGTAPQKTVTVAGKRIGEDGRIVADPQEMSAGPTSPGVEDPTDPHSQAFHRARLAEIAAADSVATLTTINRFVVRVGGDQAWTEAMTAAARQRAAELDAAPVTNGAAPDLTPEQVMAAIKVMPDSKSMTDLWSKVTIGASAQDRWTPEMTEAAHARLAWLDSQPTVAPPWGN
jgi:hypothetical protein